MMQIRIDRSVKLLILCGIAVLMLPSAFISCKKSTPVAPIPITPLQTLINSDTTLSLYHRLILQANETGLLADKAITLLIPTNAALRAEGYSPSFIDSISATQADNLVRYHYINSRVIIPVADSGAYTGYATLLGPLVFGMSDGVQVWFNGTRAIADTASVGQAFVYRLSAPLPVAFDCWIICWVRIPVFLSWRKPSCGPVSIACCRRGGTIPYWRLSTAPLSTRVMIVWEPSIRPI
jgi:hypothetical protein